MFQAHFQTFDEPETGLALGARLSSLREELVRRNLTGFVIPRADQQQNEYVPASEERLLHGPADQTSWFDLERLAVLGDTVAAWLTRTAATESYGAGLRSAREVIMAPSTPASTASASTRAAARSTPKATKWNTSRSVSSENARRLVSPSSADSCAAPSVTSGATPQPRL